MMSADDEPNQPSNDNTVNKIFTTSTNNLINEAFNLNSSSLGNSSIGILPPSSAHFKPITHSRNPSNDIKQNELQQPAPIQAPANLFNPLNAPQTKNLSSFFDQPNLTTNNILINSFPVSQTSLPSNPTVPFNSFSNPQSVNTNVENKLQTPLKSSPTNQTQSSLVHAPIPTKPSTNVTPSIQTQNTLTANLISNLPPPISVPTIAPPPSSTLTSGSGGSNPYSAKGVLNKKVYDTGVSVAPITSNTTFLKSSAETSLPSNGLFIPPVGSSNVLSTVPSNPVLNSTSSSSSTSLNFNQQTENSSLSPINQIPSSPPTNFNQYSTQNISQYPPIGQPIINLSDRMSTSLSFDETNKQQLYQQPNHQQKQHEPLQQQKSGKMWNWFSQNQFISSVVEKAKNSVEKVVTTVDPQMKEYIHPANRPIYLVSSMSNPKIAHSIREAFNDAGFSKITLNAFDIPNTSQFAPQIVGYPCALQSAKEKLDNTLNYVQNTDCIVISFQDFLAEITTENWFELAVVMLKDKTNNIDLTLYTEALPVSGEDVAQLQQFTNQDYPLKWSGFSCRLPEKNFNFNSGPSHTVLSYETPDTIISHARLSHVLKTLAILYKNKLISILQ